MILINHIFFCGYNHVRFILILLVIINCVVIYYYLNYLLRTDDEPELLLPEDLEELPL